MYKFVCFLFIARVKVRCMSQSKYVHVGFYNHFSHSLLSLNFYLLVCEEAIDSSESSSDETSRQVCKNTDI